MLHCNGKLAEMREIASRVKPLAGEASARAEAALAALREPVPLDIEAAESHLAEMVGAIA